MPRSKPEIRLVIEPVDQARAYELLSHNTNNRNLRERIVNQYVRDMQDGNWKPGAGEPIHVAPDGTIGNGQHRLYAVIEADVAIEFPFLYAPLDYRLIADQGARRTLSDMLKIEYGITQSHSYASVVRLLHEYRKTGEIGRLTGGSKTAYSVTELLNTHAAEPNLLNSMHVYDRAAHPTIRASHVIPSVAAVCHYLFSEIDPNDVEFFFERLESDVGHEDGSALLAARRFFANDQLRRQRVHAAVLIKTFNAWRAGDSIRQMRFRAGGSTPEQFPKINPPR